MPDSCCSPSKVGNPSRQFSEATIQSLEHAANLCPECGMAGKIVPGQTVSAMLNVSLRKVRAEVTYRFCRTPDCAIVYFVPDGTQTFTWAQVRERVYQKVPETDDALVCYCFRHTAGDIRASTPQQHADILADINAGIQTGQCACDLRNPQGVCCLGNVRALINQAERAAAAMATVH